MPSLNLRHGANLSGDTNVSYGNKLVDSVLTVNDPVFHVEQAVVPATHGTLTPWITGSGGISTWVWGLILSDQDIYLEMKNDIGTPQYARSFIPAGVPRYISFKVGGSTSSQLTGGALSNGTAYGSCVSIKLQNEGATAANVDLFLFS